VRAERWIYTLPLRLRSLVRRGRVEHELDEELVYHLERQIEENVARGMTEEEARYAALRAMGGIEQQKEACRDTRRTRIVEDLVQDVRYGARGLIRNRGFAVVAVLTLALGLGANTAVFSVINTVFLEPLPYREPERLAVVWEDATFVGYPRDTPAPGNFLDWERQNSSFEGMAAMRTLDLNLTGDGEPLRVSTMATTANLFSLLGVAPEIGRGFLPEEDREGGPNVVVLGHALWQNRYGGDPSVVGRDVTLDGAKYSVVGVMPAGFQVLERTADAWVPMGFGPEDATNHGSHFLFVVGRLKPGVSAEQAQADVKAITERIALEYPDEAGGYGAVVVPLREQLTGDARQPLLVLAVAVGFVLLIACINVGNLMLSRAARRRREIAVRAAIGASRSRMLRQLLAENLPLVAIGTLAGVAFAYASFGILKQLIPPGLRASSELGLDLRVLGFTLLVALAATLLFGLVPALEASRAEPNDALRRGSARTGHSTGGWLRSALVVGEVGLAIALLVGASLLIQTFFRLHGEYSELRSESVLTLATPLPSSIYDTHAKHAAFYDTAVERIGAIPGVVAVGYTNVLPLAHRGDSTSYTVEGVPVERGLERNANTRLVNPGYLTALGVPLLHGRQIAATDVADSQPVAVVNETLARAFFHDENPVGRRLKMGRPESDAPWMTVVGVAGDVRQDDVEKPAKAEIYIPYTQGEYVEFFAPRSMAVRTTGDPMSIVSAVRREIAAIDPSQPVANVRTMADVLGEETSERRLGTYLLGAFAAVALLLASIGIYGLLAQLVAQKTPEIGVRMALGARPRDVVAMVVGRGMRLVAIGVALGAILSVAMARLISSLLYGVSAGDPVTLAGVPLLLAAVALLACAIPARRAALVDPNVALRYE
jgi:putative ABC transport system permease protein